MATFAPLLPRDPAACTLLVIRHGQTAWNAERRFLGRADIPLDAVGEAQAGALAAALAPLALDRIVSSPLRRARQTAAPLLSSRPHLDLHTDPALAELDQGALEGLLGPEAIARFPDFFAAWRADPATVCLPDGEAFQDCQRRALAALQALAAAAPAGSTLAIVTHQLVLSGLLCALDGQPLSTYGQHSQRNTAINQLEWSPASGLTVRQRHWTAHLGD